MNTLTKAIVNISAVAAALFELSLASEGLIAVRVAGLALLAAVVAGWLAGRREVVSALLFLTYLAPAAWLLWYGSETYSFEIAWIAPLAVLALLGREAWRWSVPAPWRWPLVAWALVVAVSWPIVVLRELSFDPGMLSVRGAATNVAGVSPAESAMWSGYVALGHLLGLLWVDALWRWYAGAPRVRFVREVAWPLAGAAAIAAAVGAYQGFVRIDFLSGHVWPYMNRATGTLMDANTFGTLMAFWGPGLMALVLASAARGGGLPAGVGARRWTVMAAAFVLFFAGVWTSGSRTALAGFILATAAALHALWTTQPGREIRLRRASVVAVALGLAALAALVAVVARGSATTSVFARIPSLVPGMEAGTSVGRTVVDLWQRFGYGTAAMRMIAEHPLQGVGVGGFHTLVRDYSMLVADQSLAPDNAQSWYRHVLAELGLLGSLGALAWTVLFARRILAKPARSSPDPAVRIGTGVLVAFGLLSLVGVPGQSAAVIVTFWVFAFWVATALGEAAGSSPAPGGLHGRATAWPIGAAVLVVVAAHAGLTLASARTDLLPAHRAARFGWDYSFGISALERSPDGLHRRWTAERSLSTIPVQGRVLKFVAWAEHPDANERPIHLRVVADGTQVFEGELRRQSAIRLDIPAAPGAKTLVLETFIDRTFRPSDYGSRDRRDLGLAILDWRWE